jgi:hypothetical protein
MLAAWDLTTPINPNDLSIDNTDLSVDEVCRRIAKALHLEASTRPV